MCATLHTYIQADEKESKKRRQEEVSTLHVCYCMQSPINQFEITASAPMRPLHFAFPNRHILPSRVVGARTQAAGTAREAAKGREGGGREGRREREGTRMREGRREREGRGGREGSRDERRGGGPGGDW